MWSTGLKSLDTRDVNHGIHNLDVTTNYYYHIAETGGGNQYAQEKSPYSFLKVHNMLLKASLGQTQ